MAPLIAGPIPRSGDRAVPGFPAHGDKSTDDRPVAAAFHITDPGV